MLAMIMMVVGMMGLVAILIEKDDLCQRPHCFICQDRCADRVAGVGMGSMIPLLLSKRSIDMEGTPIALPMFAPFHYL